MVSVEAGACQTRTGLGSDTVSLVCDSITALACRIDPAGRQPDDAGSGCLRKVARRPLGCLRQKFGGRLAFET